MLSGWRSFAVTCVVVLVACASLTFAQDTTRPTTAPSTRPARVKNPLGAIDKLVQIETPSSWSDGTFSNATVHADYPPRIELAYKDSDFPRIGTWISPETKAAFPFTELIASFNPSCPPNTGVAMDVRVQQDDNWSPWVFLQSWGKTLTPPGRDVKWDGGRADIDTLVLDSNRPAQRWQARVTLYSFEFDPTSSPSPSVRRLSVCYSGVVTDPKHRAKILEDSNDPTTRPVATSAWARDLPVPFRGQGDYKNPRVLWSMICSPTSTSMVLEYYGINRTTVENAMAIYDEHYDLFGNWGRAVSRAGELGLDAYLTRFRNWDQVHAKIAEGVPVIASIKFRKGAVKGFLYDETDGHLLVIRGFKDNGDVIVNDPARREKGNGVVYQADEMAKAWFDNGGVGYVIEKPKRPIGITQEPSATQPTDAKADAR